MVSLDEYLVREQFVKDNDLPLSDIKSYWPSLLPVSNLESRVDLIVNQLGLDRKVLNHAPIFGYSDSNITGTVGFLRTIISDEQINNWPAYIGCSLRRMRECYEHLTINMGYDTEDLNLNKIIWSISKQNVIDNKTIIDGCTNLPDKFKYQDNPNILLQKPAQLRNKLRNY